jgi:endonuclease/exonuclease/phosphatase family metal-dependent hydrolase
VYGGRVRVLSWNLKHGRAEPSAGRDLFNEFAVAIAGWEWDVALLQEVPPWWPEPLGARTRAAARRVLTSRNTLLPLRRAIAERWPDVIKSNGGGSNAILVRGAEVLDHRTRRLCRLPERRWVHAVRARRGAFGDGIWVANLHASAHFPARALRDNRLAAQTVIAWSTHAPCVLGGDLNLRELELPGFTHVGGRDVDHIFVRALRPVRELEVLERGHLSDHPPVLAELAA